MVRVIDIQRGDYSFERPRPFIVFRVYIFNGSVFPVSIEPKISGFISYANRRLGGQLSLSTKYQVTNLQRGWNGSIEIHHWLTQGDADFIKGDQNAANHFFNLEQIVLTITGGEPFYDIIKSRPLKIDGGVDLSGRQRG